MLYSKKKQLIFLATFIVLFLICSSFVSALEIEYPEMGGEEVSSSTSFKDYVGYIYNFAIIVSGIVAFGVIVWAGIKILTSPDQPDTIKDARTKMIGAFLGIIILLSSYLILKTIGVLFPDLPDLKPNTGIYLISDTGSKTYLTDSTLSVSAPNAKTVEFLSTKDELSSIYVYDQEDYKGTEQEIPNTKLIASSTVTAPISSPKSIAFIWNRPGIYLYPETGYVGRPRYFNSSVSSLTSHDFNDSASSIRFKHGTSTPDASGLYEVYGTLLFSEDSYKGSCDYYALLDVPDLSVKSSITPPIGTKKLSSFYLFKTFTGPIEATPPITGDVTFYDHIDCKGNKYVQPASAGNVYVSSPNAAGQFFDGSFDGTKLPVETNILSFEINGNFSVILNTENNMKGRCQLFKKPADTNCIRTLKGEYVYGEAVGEDGEIIQLYRIKSYLIVGTD